MCSCSKKAFPNIDDKTELWMAGGSCKNLYVVNQNINRATSQIYFLDVQASPEPNPVSWLVGPLLTLSHFHCVGVS